MNCACVMTAHSHVREGALRGDGLAEFICLIGTASTPARQSIVDFDSTGGIGTDRNMRVLTIRRIQLIKEIQTPAGDATICGANGATVFIARI